MHLVASFSTQGRANGSCSKHDENWHQARQGQESQAGISVKASPDKTVCIEDVWFSIALLPGYLQLFLYSSLPVLHSLPRGKEKKLIQSSGETEMQQFYVMGPKRSQPGDRNELP